MQTTTDVDATKILEKGPEYLRKQMELESETTGRMSAVERLAATKPKYVKSQQVINSTQESVISLGSASVSSNGSSKRSGNNGSGRNSPVGTTGAQGGLSAQEDNVVRRTSSKKRPDSLLLYRQKCELIKGSTREKNKRNLGRRLLLTSLDRESSLPEASGKECESEENGAKLTTPEEAAKECDSKKEHSQAKQTVTQYTQNDEPTEQESGDAKVAAQRPRLSVGIRRRPPLHKRVGEVQRRCGKGVGRSHSDISSRYSKNFADFDAFFKYCGLDGEVIESLGKENFSARSDEFAITIRSISVSTSDDGFSQNSDDIHGLQEEELHENIRQGTSVIERNARIIKWLYSCKNAKDSGKKLRDLE